jgi:antitoxin VapB
MVEREYVSTMNKHEPTPAAAQLNIKSAEARRLADELAELTGETLTEAVTLALRYRLAKERRTRRPGEIAARLMALGSMYSSLPIKDDGTLEEILGYDENGLPT